MVFSVLEYQSRGRGFESLSGHLYSQKLSQLIYLKNNMLMSWVRVLLGSFIFSQIISIDIS